MVYNEAALLPVWLRHYAAQVGAAHCYVVDHGSDDGSVSELGQVSVIRLPRSPLDDPRRARFLSGFCSDLLEWYDGVIHTDVDEIVLADPAEHADLPSFFAATEGPVSSAVGLNVIQMTDEPALDATQNVLGQRRYVAFSSALCKPVLIRRPVRWSPGFHCADAPLRFEGLLLFHLRYCDRAWAMARLARTRVMPRAPDGGGGHQRVSDAEFLEMLGNFARMPRRDEAVLDPARQPLASWLAAVRDSQAGRQLDTYTIDLHLNAYELWPIPRQFGTNPPPLAETSRATHR